MPRSSSSFSPMSSKLVTTSTPLLVVYSTFSSSSTAARHVEWQHVSLWESMFTSRMHNGAHLGATWLLCAETSSNLAMRVAVPQHVRRAANQAFPERNRCRCVWEDAETAVAVG